MNRLIGNRVAERDVRDWLNEHGFFGNAAQIDELELYAISRPGWIQVFRFRVTVKHRSEQNNSGGVLKSETNEEKREYFGVSRDDERRRDGQKTEVDLFSSVEQQEIRLAEWSTDLIVRTSEHSFAILLFVVLVLVGFMAVAGIVSLLT